jgi:hypothetical protein
MLSIAKAEIPQTDTRTSLAGAGVESNPRSAKNLARFVGFGTQLGCQDFLSSVSESRGRAKRKIQ